MSYPIQYAPINSVVYFPFASYGKTNGESITLTGLAVTDIEVYKLPSMTQRASDNGYALLDTDGIDLDGITGIHGFSVDLSDNSDTGFFEVGAWYMVVVSSVTVDGQTVNFIAGMMRLMEEENPSGVPDVNVTHWNGSAVPLPNVAGVPEVDVTHNDGVAISANSGRQEVNVTHVGGATASQAGGLLNANVTQVSGDATAADNLEAMLDGTGGQTLHAVVLGISGIAFPTNFALMAIDADGITAADIQKVNQGFIQGTGLHPDTWRPL